ncbi:MAG: 2-oxoglutarate oxidoreductase [Lachnospiraceae bacterium]|nr:2-oxoglutarate oxidoreductase [Lachnospiraceae bacterium]MBR6349406.1 2-oxoglutarate oxidoreductase [Lachnospiraceae bacterium]
MAKNIKAPEALKPHRFCPGCGHGVIARVIMEVIESRGLTNNFILNRGVGCCCNLRSIEVDGLQCSHGRSCASTRAMKLLAPDTCFVTYQGDGDAYVIGLQETLNAAYAKSNITLITVNNSNFGMTGGQMAWTTLPGQITTTSPYGRPVDGPLPIQIPEMIANSFDPAFVARASVQSPAEINKLKKYVEKAIDAQMAGKGFTMIEVLAPCPTNWGLTPEKAIEHVATDMQKYYPLGVFADRT